MKACNCKYLHTIPESADNCQEPRSYSRTIEAYYNWDPFVVQQFLLVPFISEIYCCCAFQPVLAMAVFRRPNRNHWCNGVIHPYFFFIYHNLFFSVSYFHSEALDHVSLCCF